MKKSLTREDVIRISVDEGLPPEFALNIWQQESSSGKNSKTSVDGAVGGFQVMPRTFAAMMPNGKIKDPLDNARAGIRFLKQNYDKHGGDPASVYASYHSGSPGFYSRRGSLKKDGLGKTTLSYTTDALRRHDALAQESAKLLASNKSFSIQVPSTEKAKAVVIEDNRVDVLDTLSQAGQDVIEAIPGSVTPKNTPAVKYALAIEPPKPTSPYGDDSLTDLDRKLLKLIEEV